MEEINNNQEQQELTEEEKIEQASRSADSLLSELEKTKNKFADVLAELNEKQSDIENLINEISTAKETFIKTINEQLSHYDEKFRKNNEAINTQKDNVEKSSSELVSKFTALTEKYEQEANTAIEKIQGKIDESTNMLKGEKGDFDKFLSDNRANYDKQFKEIDSLISQYKASTKESTTTIDSRKNDSVENSAKIKQIYAEMEALKEEIDTYISNMNLKTKEIDEKTKKYSADTQDIININKEQTKEIDKQLRLATGRSLFHSFHKRKKDLEKSQLGWLIALGISIGLLVLFSIWLVHEFGKIDWQNVDWFVDIILKISASTPILYLVAFVTDRYTKERRLVEEYAFKSTISLALKPYFDMVSSEEITDEEREFLIKSIENIFTTPTDKVYRTKECQNKIDFAHLSELSETVKNIENKINEHSSK